MRLSRDLFIFQGTMIEYIQELSELCQILYVSNEMESQDLYVDSNVFSVVDQ